MEGREEVIEVTCCHTEENVRVSCYIRGKCYVLVLLGSAVQVRKFPSTRCALTLKKKGDSGAVRLRPEEKSRSSHQKKQRGSTICIEELIWV